MQIGEDGTRSVNDGMLPGSLSHIAWAFAHSGQYDEDLFIQLADGCRACIQVTARLMCIAWEYVGYKKTKAELNTA